jgi:L-alanine-DL-glutamate epimerase-like enolase superfamily enzyme
MDMQIEVQTWPLHAPFQIARGGKTDAQTLCVTLTHGDITGHGACVPYARYGESNAQVIAQLEAVRAHLHVDIEPEAAQDMLPAGAARNALDCALWDFWAKKSGERVWELAGLDPPGPVQTAFTLSLDSAQAMAEAARAASQYPLLKVKIGAPDDLARLRAIAAARPDARLIVDANEGLSDASLPALLEHARALHIDVIEQPFAVKQDWALGQVAAPVAICADESFHTRADIEQVLQNYDAVNIKLDKTGGLTEGLKTVRAARAAGLRIMVGCMVGTSLCMAPAILLAQMADWVDLDGPLWLAKDCSHPLVYGGATLHPPDPLLWG